MQDRMIRDAVTGNLGANELTIYEATYGWVIGRRTGETKFGCSVVNRISCHKTRREAERALELLIRVNCEHEWGMSPNAQSPDMCIHCGESR